MRAALLSLAALACGCHEDPNDYAKTGAIPAVATPVGPIPGPGEEPEATASPYKASPEILQDGRRLFVRWNCSGCHGGHGGGGMAPSLRDKDWIYGNSDAHIYDSIVEGRAHGMPAWATHITEPEVWKVVAYIQSMRTDREPEPPL